MRVEGRGLFDVNMGVLPKDNMLAIVGLPPAACMKWLGPNNGTWMRVTSHTHRCVDLLLTPSIHHHGLCACVVGHHSHFFGGWRKFLLMVSMRTRRGPANEASATASIDGPTRVVSFTTYIC